MKGRWSVWAGVVLAAAIAIAPDATARRRITYEVSMVISGAVDIDAEGRPTSLEIDHADRLDAAVVEYVKRQASGWVFQPVVEAGVAVPIHSLMNLRLVLKPADEAFEIRMAGIVFFDRDPATALEADGGLPPPRYPQQAFRSGVGAHVYVAVQVDEAGAVRDAVVEQVNLKVTGDPRSMRKWRDVFASACLEAARQWKFKPPGRTPDGGEFWTERIPMDFSVGEIANHANPPPPRVLAYGQWEPYFPGPRTPIPWPRDADPPGFSPDVNGVPAVDPDERGSGKRNAPRSALPPRARLSSVSIAAPADGE